VTSVGAETGVKAGIVLATYNGAQFLPEQLQTFLTQERLPDELLVSDDVSTDDTLAIVEGFARKAPFPVRVSINPERLGFIQNFAKALALSDADVIFMSDQDDVWFPSKLATMLAAVEVHPDKMLFVCDAELVEEDLSPTGLTIFGQKNPEAGGERSSTYGCCFAMRRELLDYVLPIPDGYDFHDKWMAHLAKDLGVLRAIDVPLQQYRRHGSNASWITMVRPEDRPGMATQARDRVAVDVRFYLRQHADQARLRLDRLERLAAARKPDGGSPALDVAGAAARVRSGLRRFEARLALLERSRVLRLPGVVRMLVRGDYADFSGARSAAVDLLRK
jgi:glycosyltransferase involved in cell wall biosynthesis